MNSYRRQLKIGAMLTSLLVIVTFGAVVAHTVTRPLTVTVRSHIRICQKTAKGAWQVIDEVGPASFNFDASLLELSKGRKLSSAFVWQTKTKKGRPYRVRLLEPAKVKFQPVGGKFEADLVFEVTLAGKTARVPARLTTEGRSGPLGMLRGQRAKGVLGRERSTFTLVSANTFRPDKGSAPLMLVCKEKYTLTPKK